jgi:hypothetical protein
VFLIIASYVEVSIDSRCSNDAKPFTVDLIVKRKMYCGSLFHGNVSSNHNASQLSVGRVLKIKLSRLPRSVIPSPCNYCLEACACFILSHLNKINVENARGYNISKQEGGKNNWNLK